MAQTILIKRSNTSSAVPTTSQLSVGELALNTRDGKIYMRKYVDGTTGNDTITLIGDTSTIAGSAITGNLSFGDNVKAQFGTGNDLQIYHDGSASYIKENGTGDLIIQGSNTMRLQGSSNQELANFSTGGAVTLFNNNSAKLATTATGIDVTGTATMDAAKVETSTTSTVTISENTGSGTAELRFVATDTFPKTKIVTDVSAASLTLETLGNDRLKIANNGDIQFYEDTGTTAKLTWDASAEALGIGTTTVGGSATTKLHLMSATTSSPTVANDADELIIEGTGSSGMTFLSTTASNIRFGDTADSSVGQIRYTHSTDSLAFGTNNTTRMTIDSSGNVLVGKSASSFNTAGAEIRASGVVIGTVDGAAGLIANRLTSDGTLIQLSKDGTTVGSIGTIVGRLFIGNDDVFLTFQGASDRIYPASSSGGGRDNAIDLGEGGTRFKDIYATNGTIQTSDRNEKQDIAELSDAEQRVAVTCKGLLRKFRWKDSVAEKGDDARTHFGIIAQDLQAAFEAEGLDAGDYAMFISTTWTDEETNEEKTRMGVRYSELLAFIISAI